ncbi:MAG TPA: SPOR domain-containing protein [Bacteroidota bacterium]
MTRNACRSTFVATLLGAALLAGCISSEGTGGGGKSREPEKSVGPIDTSRTVARTNASVQTGTSANPAKRGSRSTKFTARQDTVKASLVRRNKPSVRLPKVERPENPAFTVQIGAFVRPNNALRNQKVAKSRFSKYPVFSNFDARSKFYRVSVGKFITRREAVAVRQQILKSYPKEYSACWVNYIAK